MRAVRPIEEILRQSRRDFLTTTASGLGGIALTAMLAKDSVLRAAPSSSGEIVNPLVPGPPHFAPRAKACIFLFMAGAPSQIDLFDPKPKLRELDGQPLPESMLEKVRFAFIQKDTAVLKGSKAQFKKRGQCGMQISEYLPHIGNCADDIALVRSIHTEAFNHHPGQLMMNTGVPTFGRPSMGSWLNYGLGSESENLPGYVVLTAGRGTSGGASNWSSGFLPSTYQGVLFRNQGDPVLNLTEGDWKVELGYRPGVFATFARNCLLARRMVERGVRFVNIYHASWDHHSDLDKELPFNCHMADQPVAALIKDLKQRGMLDETLVIWGAEFGRTPLGENSIGKKSNTGRDHHPFAFSIFMAGGGIKGGKVIGRTDEIGWNIVEDPIHINDFHATLLHLFGLDHLRLTYRFQGGDLRLTDVAGKVIQKLLA